MVRSNMSRADRVQIIGQSVGRVRSGNSVGQHILALAVPVHALAYECEDVVRAIYASFKDRPDLSVR